MKVYVINMHGKPLMPCGERKARLLLKERKAKVIRMEPFTIRLLYGSYGYRQPVSLGVDAGGRHVGLSATTVKEELFSAEVTLRTDVTRLLSDRMEARRTRRNRKTRYRAPRFNNRVAAKREGWIAPTVSQKLNSHVQAVMLVHKLMPVKSITVEVADFDAQKIRNPEVSGEEYQKGEQLGFWNVREYVLFRDGHVCRHCKGKSKDPILNVHHIESRKTGGDSPGNLITLCETCHKAYHRGEIKLKLKRGSASLRDAAFMNIVRWRVYNELRSMYEDVSLTHGYKTKHYRIRKGLVKTHCTDAFCITGNLTAEVSGGCYYFRCVRRHNRSMHVSVPAKGGERKRMIAPYYLGKSNITRYDKVLCNGEKCFVFGSSNGYASIRNIEGDRAAGVNTVISPNKLELIYHKRSGMICDYRRINKLMQETS